MLQSFIENYGYLAILIGTFFEGETILILAGLAAHLGYLQLPWVIAAAFTGSLAGDQLYFRLGRRHGQRWLERRPRWQRRSHRVLVLLERHQTLLIIGFRFLYGLRTAAPFVIGMSGISPQRFLLLNTIGALLWSVAVGVLGYLFGHTFELLLGEIRRYELELFTVIAIAGLLVWAWRWWRN